jgi:hypothetical protein
VEELTTQLADFDALKQKAQAAEEKVKVGYLLLISLFFKLLQNVYI